MFPPNDIAEYWRAPVKIPQRYLQHQLGLNLERPYVGWQFFPDVRSGPINGLYCI